MTSLVLAIGSHMALAGDQPACDMAPPSPEDLSEPWVDWSHTGDDIPVLRLRAPQQGEFLYAVDVRLKIGPVSSIWSVGPYAIEPGETLEVPIELGAEAWLHALSGDYVSALQVRVSIEDESTFRYGVLTPPDLFVGWPDGEWAPPAAWTREEQEVYAPHGVTDPDLQEEADAIGPDVWLAPPIDSERRAARTVPLTTVSEEIPPMESEEVSE